MVMEGKYHNTVNYTTLPNSSMTTDLLLSCSVITPMSHIVCTPVSLCTYTPLSPGVSAPVLSSAIKHESHYVPVRENRMADRCVRKDSSSCDPSHITQDRGPHAPVNHTVVFLCHGFIKCMYINEILMKTRL